MNRRYLILVLALLLLATHFFLRERDEKANPRPPMSLGHGHDHSGHDHGGHYHGDGHDHTGEDLPDGPPTKAGDREASEPKFITTASGLQYQILFKGDGPTPTPDDRVKVHYEGSTEDGAIFDSNIDRDPSTFPVKGVIKGWQEGLQLMPAGSRFRFIIPADLAYGERGHPPLIQPGATLYFDIELLDVPPTQQSRIEAPVFNKPDGKPSQQDE